MVCTKRLAAACLCLALGERLLAQKTPEEALRALHEGNRRFAAEKSVPQPLGEGVRRTLARGQSPFAIVLCCADSRVPPEHVFNAGLGELFVVRVAGNTCDSDAIASIEYAVEHLNVPLCVVLGHEGCTTVAAATAQVQGQELLHRSPAPSPAMQQLLEQIEPAVRKATARDLLGKDLANACEEENVQLSVHECLRRSTLLRRYAQVGKFQMVGARYHLQSGEVEWLPTRPLPAVPVATVEPHRAPVPMSMPPHVALRVLQAGHRRFLGDGLPSADLSAQRRSQLLEAEQPIAIVLCCADSRTAPEHVFDAGLGELLVIRVAGNAIDDDVLASIEHAASHTGASLLVVMGHTRCGAVTAAAQHPESQQLTPSMRALLARLEPAVARARAEAAKGQDVVDLAVRGNTLRAIAEARSRSAILRDLEQQGRFAMLPAIYDIASGDLCWLKDVPATAEAPPPATPGGETGADHGGATHPAADPHARPGQASAAEPGQHGEGAQPKVLDWADSSDAHIAVPGKPAAGTHQEHAPGALQAASHATSAHVPPPPAGAGNEDAHAPGAQAGHPGHAEARWNDPIVLVGLSGVASLLLAALVAVMKR